MSEEVTLAEVPAPEPTITVSVTGAIATVNFAGTVSTTDGFGHCSIEVSL